MLHHMECGLAASDAANEERTGQEGLRSLHIMLACILDACVTLIARL